MSNSILPKVTIEISHKDQYKDAFFERCIGQVVRDQRLIDKLPEWSPYDLNSVANPTTFMVWYYEDKTLKEMRTKTGAAYQKLFEDMKWIGETLRCNITVFLGHLEICENYVETTYKASLEASNQRQFTLPTIFLIIACYTNKLANKYNTDPVFAEKKIAFFGFEDFMHIHEGEIYGCKDVHKAPPSLECSYDTVQKDLESLLEVDKNGAKKSLNNVRQKRVDLENPLVKCCEAKEAAMYDLFVKYLDHRNCVKFTKEKLMEKFRPFVTNPEDRSILASPNATLVAADGIVCKDGSCGIPNPYVEASKQSKVFNDMSTKLRLYKELEASWKVGLPEFTAKLKTIKEKDGSILTYKPDEETLPFLAQLIENKRNYDLKEMYSIILSILKTYGQYLKFNVRYGKETEALLHTIRQSSLPEGKQYFLYTKIYELVNPEEREALFFQKNKYGEIPFLSSVVLGKKVPLLLLVFYIENFGPKLKDVKCSIIKGYIGNLLHALLLYQDDHLEYTINTNNNRGNINLNSVNNVWMNCLKGLLELGVDPNMTLKKVWTNDRFIRVPEEYLTFLESLKPLHLHLYLYKPPSDADNLINLFLSYGMTNSDKYFSKQYEFYSQQISTPEAFRRYIVSLKKLYVGLEEGIGYNVSKLNNTQDINVKRDITIYVEEFYKILPAIEENTRDYIGSLSEEYGVEVVKRNIDLFKQCILFFSIQKRKNYREKLAKTKKNRKTNLNISMKKYKNKVRLTYNIDSLLRSKMKEIDELIKYGTFTKEEKEEYRKSVREYRQMDLPPKQIYSALETQLKYIQELSNLGKEINKVKKDIEDKLTRLNAENSLKINFRKEVQDTLANDEEYTKQDKLDKLKEILVTIRDWPLILEIQSIREQVNSRLNTLSDANIRKQRYKNEISALVEDEHVSNQQFLEALKRIQLEISV
jgi:hypothetical protein